MITDYWPLAFRNLYGGEWPQTYCCIDVETTGYSFDRDVITEWGHCLVQDGKVIDQLSLIVDWSDHAVVPDHWLRERLRSLQNNMALAGKHCHISYERMKREGRKPAEALAFMRDFAAKVAANQILFVLHNGTFDEKMLAANFIGFKIAPGFSLGDNGYIDTEAIEKATQVPANPRMHPKPQDTLRSYFMRVKNSRITGIRSNLDDHCYRKYQFAEKYGISPEQMHGAKTDAYCTHLLMQEFGARLTSGVKPLPLGVAVGQPAAASAAPSGAALGASFKRLRRQRVS